MDPSSSKNPSTSNSQIPSHCPSPNSLRNHPPSTILDLLIFILVISSSSYLVYSYISYLLHCFSLLFPSFSFYSLVMKFQPRSILSSFSVYSFLFMLLICRICCYLRGRTCGKDGCQGFRYAIEHELRLQDEECLKRGRDSESMKEIEELPIKDGWESNPQFQSLSNQLKRLAPPNGRAVLIFKYKCGCSYAKLEIWGPKPGGRRPKKGLANHGDRR